MTSLRDSINQHAREQSTNLQVINSQSSQIKTLNEGLRRVNGRVDAVIEEQVTGTCVRTNTEHQTKN